jgi:putative transcriptional regulator
MTTRKKSRARARDDVLASVHESAADLFEAGLIGKATMREYDQLCLRPVDEFTPREIAAIRREASVSQPIFAAYLNVTKATVSQWERGEKKPNGPARKLLDLVRRKGLHALA